MFYLIFPSKVCGDRSEVFFHSNNYLKLFTWRLDTFKISHLAVSSLEWFDISIKIHLKYWEKHFRFQTRYTHCRRFLKGSSWMLGKLRSWLTDDAIIVKLKQ